MVISVDRVIWSLTLSLRLAAPAVTVVEKCYEFDIGFSGSLKTEFRVHSILTQSLIKGLSPSRSNDIRLSYLTNYIIVS